MKLNQSKGDPCQILGIQQFDLDVLCVAVRSREITADITHARHLGNGDLSPRGVKEMIYMCSAHCNSRARIEMNAKV